MVAFFNLGAQELVILGILGLLGVVVIGAVIAVAVYAGGKKDD
jgi:hypothetical protein